MRNTERTCGICWSILAPKPGFGEVVSVRPWHGRSQTPGPGVLSLSSRHVRVLCSSEDTCSWHFQTFFKQPLTSLLFTL